MHEKDLFDSIVKADRYFREKYSGRYNSNEHDVFPRWLSLNFGIVVCYDFAHLFISHKGPRPWRVTEPGCIWKLVRCRDEEKVVMFKLMF